MTKAASAGCGASMSKDEQRWQTERDVSTLRDADEIHRDPTRHARAKKHATKQITSYRRIAGGR